MPTHPVRRKPTAAQRKAAAARKAAKAEKAAAGESPNGVMVVRIPTGDGVNYGFEIHPVGDVRATEIGDILAYGLRHHRKQTDPD